MDPRQPFIDDPDLKVYVGDALSVLRELPDESVDTVCTSPPYWGLRDYGVEGQLGLEPTPEEYVQNLVSVFREVRRVLAPHGSLWLNLGDSFAADHAQTRSRLYEDGRAMNTGIHSRIVGSKAGESRGTPIGLKPKDLCGVPWMVAFALRADGWWLRSEVIWAKGISFCDSYSGSCMPESVTDRPAKSHETVFLLTKNPRYYFDMSAIREPAEWARWGDQTNGKHEGSESAATWIGSSTKEDLRARATPSWEERKAAGAHPGKSFASKEVHDLVGSGTQRNVHGDGLSHDLGDGRGRNVRSVWAINPQPFSEAHFATWPERLVRPMILAGCPEQVCRTCGAPRERLTERPTAPPEIKEKGSTKLVASEVQDFRYHNVGGQKYQNWLDANPRETVGFTDCGHGDYRPGVVLDPFLGSGTTALVARKLGRHVLGIELSETYAREIIAARTQQQSLFAAETA